MKTQIKKFFFTLATFSLAQFAFTLETGGLFTNDTDFSNKKKDGDLELTQKNAVNLWLKQPVSQDGLSYFTAEGEFRTEYNDYIKDSDKKLTLAADVSLFKLVISQELEQGDIKISAGRFYNEDLSGLVYAQNGDGAKAEVALERFNISLFGAYTGLLNAKNVTLIGPLQPKLTKKEKTLYVVSKKFGVGALTFELPYFFQNQTLALEGLGAFSLESTKWNRFYATGALSGPIVSPVFYNVSSTLGFSKYDKADMTKGNLTKASISVYPDFKSMSVSLNGLYASGGEKGSIKAFEGFTSGTADESLTEPEYTEIAKIGLSGTIKPIPTLLISAGGDIVFDTAGGDNDDKIKNKGFQYTAGVTCKAASDVSVGASVAQFIGTKDYKDANNKTQFKITAAIAF